MEALLRELWQLREIQELAQLMESGGGPALVTGLSPVHRAMTAAALRLKSGRPLLMLCADEGEARRQAADLRSLTGREPVLLTGRELHWRELAAVSRQWEYRRLEALYRIRQEESPVIVTTADALALRCIPPQVLERCRLHPSLRRAVSGGGVGPAADGGGLYLHGAGGGAGTVRPAGRYSGRLFPRCRGPGTMRIF